MRVTGTKRLGRASFSAVLVGLAVGAQAQAPVQFSGEIQVRDLDGGIGTGKLYVGATKQRMEFTAFGEVRPTIVDPPNDTQQTISPRQRNFMEMPRGESGGPVRIPRLGPVDPNNPCATGQMSECMRLGAEMVNGQATQKWEYTNTDGERVTSWISTRLRFPVKTIADSGATNDIRNIVEGPQAANLFAVPNGFAQVDDIGGSGNAIADALASINPALMQQGLANAKKMEAEMKADPTRGARAAQWEAGAGYVMNLTVTMRAAHPRGDNPNRWSQSNISVRYTTSVPMNYGTPAVPPNVGPRWGVLQAAGSGSPQAEAIPATLNLEWEEQIQTHINEDCVISERSDTTTTVKGSFTGRGLITQPATQSYAQAQFQINGALTSYNFGGGVTFNTNVESTAAARRVDHCLGDRVTNTTNTTRTPMGNLGMDAVNIQDVPLPPTPAGLRGTRNNVPWRFSGYQGPATVEWTITPITAR
jgi:hypothetical protein